MATFIDTSMLPAGKYLADSKTIRVPENQRSYAWTDDEVTQLWEDLLDSIDNSRPEYFIGPVVAKKLKNSELEIIDGQQRLTTILIMVSAIRSVFRANGDSQRADLLSKKFFGEKDIMTLETTQKFYMNDENGAVFRDFISTEIDIGNIRKEQTKYPKKNANWLLLQAVITVRDLIASYHSPTFDSDKLLRLYKYLTENLMILVLSVEDEADAYTIFETLNDRGRSLDTFDLLKNHLFSKAKSHLPEVKEKWSIVRENLLEVDPKNRFLYHFWLSLHGRASKTGLFRSIRDHVSNASDSVKFSNQLATSSRLYAALHTPSSPAWDDYKPETRKNIAALVLLDAQQALPVLLGAHEKFEHEEFTKLTRLLVVMAVRYNFIGEERTGVASNYYAEISKKIRSGDFGKTSHVLKYLKPIYPSDTSFEAAFSSKSIIDSRRARYILAEIENSLSGEKEKVVNSDPHEVDLEHILPKNINQHWDSQITQISAADHKEYVNRIGNLAIVTKSKNKGSGAKSFEVKKNDYLSTSGFETTKMVCGYNTWNRSAIERRQADIAKMAVKTWFIQQGD